MTERLLGRKESQQKQERDRKTNKHTKKEGKKLHRNYIYFKNLEERIKKYPKVDPIETDTGTEEGKSYKLPKSISRMVTENMTERLLGRKKQDKYTTKKYQEETKI